MRKIHEGGCFCGNVRYRVIGLPTWIGACHCRQCQSYTGSAFSMGAYFIENEVHVSGELKKYRYNSDESGRWHQLEFCTNCGTNVTWTGETTPGERGIAIGTFDDPDWIDVRTHTWTRSAHHSVQIPPDAEVFSTGPS